MRRGAEKFTQIYGVSEQMITLRNVDLITVRFAAWRFYSCVLKKSFA
jgi:hypothetical protein